MASTRSDINVLKGLEIPKRKAQFPLWSVRVVEPY